MDKQMPDIPRIIKTLRYSNRISHVNFHIGNFNDKAFECVALYTAIPSQELHSKIARVGMGDKWFFSNITNSQWELYNGGSGIDLYEPELFCIATSMYALGITEHSILEALASWIEEHGRY